MSSSEFNWESLLCTDAAGRSLKAGLFTTYDRADGRLLGGAPFAGAAHSWAANHRARAQSGNTSW